MSKKELYCGMLCASIATFSVAAQDQTENDSDTLEAIIVSGELQENDLQETSTSVTVFSKKQLENSNDKSITDKINKTANVSSSFGNIGFSIRGINQVGGAINISVDGASLPTNTSAFFGPYSTWDLEQVEILKGAQSTQQGRNALAGAVSVRTADPTFERETKVKLGAGSDGLSTFSLVHNQPINDHFAARIAVERTHEDGFINNVTRNDDEFAQRDLSLIRGKLLYFPNDDTSIILGHSYTENRGEFNIISLSDFPERRVNFSDAEADQGSTHNITSLNVEHDFNDQWTLSSETTYYKHDYDRIQDRDNTALPLGTADRELSDRSFSQELKLTFDSDEKLRGAVGIYATTIDSTTDRSLQTDASTVTSQAPLGFANFSRLIDRETETDNIAVFGEFNYDLSDKWELTAGARYDYEKVKINDQTTFAIDQAALVPLLPDSEIFDTNTSFNAFLPKIGLKYRFNDDVNTSFTVQRGYRAGGASRNAFTLEVNEFDPEFTTTYELALRSTLLDNRLRVNANVYYTKWEDQQVRVLGDSGNSNDVDTRNAGESTLYGAELDVDFAINQRLTIYSSLGYAKTQYDEFISAGNDLSGNEFARAPKFTASLGGKYQFNQQWSIGLDGNYKSSYYGDAENTDSSEVGSRFLLDARIAYKARNWSASLYSTNLLDKDYLTLIEGDGTGRVGDPRQVGLEFEYDF